MGISNLFNNKQKVGTVKTYDTAIKSMFNKKHKLVTSLVLTANIITSVLTGCSLSPNDMKSSSNTSETEIEQEYTDEKVYIVETEDGELLVNSDYLNDYSYVPIDDIEYKNDYLNYTFAELYMEFPEKSAELDRLYTEYVRIYNNYLFCDSKEGYYTKKFMEEKQNYFIGVIAQDFKKQYVGKAISYSDYVKTTYKDEKMNVSIIVNKGDTLSNIIDSYADDKEEFRKAFDYATLSNDYLKKKDGFIPDVDYIEAGQELNLAYVGPEDLDKLNLEYEYNINDMIRFIYKYQNGIKPLAGDFDSLHLNKQLMTSISEALNDYKNNNYEEIEFKSRLRSILQDINLLTGDEYKAPVVTKKRVL